MNVADCRDTRHIFKHKSRAMLQNYALFYVQPIKILYVHLKAHPQTSPETIFLIVIHQTEHKMSRFYLTDTGKAAASNTVSSPLYQHFSFNKHDFFL
jgi:hypothetical protein